MTTILIGVRIWHNFNDAQRLAIGREETHICKKILNAIWHSKYDVFLHYYAKLDPVKSYLQNQYALFELDLPLMSFFNNL